LELEIHSFSAEKIIDVYPLAQNSVSSRHFFYLRNEKARWKWRPRTIHVVNVDTVHQHNLFRFVNRIHIMTSPDDGMPVPKEWPPEVADLYKPVRVLGRGGFASVVLARDKGDSKLVAMKVVGKTKDKTRQQQLTYAHREIDILKELSHPNIMKVLNFWEVPDNQEEQAAPATLSSTICVMALQYYRGPTVESLLQYGGALSNKFGRVVIAQAMDAVAYLHYRAVVHRDIKPDNLIVSGALSKDDEIWDNPAEEGSGLRDAGGEPDWGELLSRWKVTLVDFGFARPLTPSDVKKPTLELRRENLRASFHAQSIDLSGRGNSAVDGSNHSRSRSRRGSRAYLGRDDPLNQSFSHRLKRSMSALGNRNFAAPEIINMVAHDKNSGGPVSDLTGTISEYVADYGLLVDSYSMGFTIRNMMTGVPPYMSVEEAISDQNSLCNKLCGKKSTARRSIRYRRISELPGEVQRLIQHLTEKSESKRVSIRSARRTYPWISDVFAGTDQEKEEQQHALNKISYLPLVLRKEEGEREEAAN
jgi:serine/threonine protein kinase